MPKIPQGSFSSEPSLRVQKANVPKVQAIGSDNLGKLGREFIQMSDEITKNKSRADALSSVNDINDADTVDGGFMAEAQRLLSSSTDGTVIDGRGEKISLSKAMDNHVDPRHTENTAGFSLLDDPEAAIKVYNSSSLVGYEKLKKEARVTEAKLMTSNLHNIHKNQGVAQVQKEVNGIYSERERKLAEQGFLQSAALAQPVVGSIGHSKIVSEYHSYRALQAPKYITSRGATEENLSHALSMVKNVPEGERIALTAKVHETYEQQLRAEAKASDSHFEALFKDKTLQETLEELPQIAELDKEYSTAPLAEREMPSKRIDKLAQLRAKSIGLSAIYGSREKTPEELTGAENENKMKDMQTDSLDIIKGRIDANIEAFFTSERGLASLGEIEEIVGKEHASTLKKSIKDKAYSDAANYVKRRGSDPKGIHEESDGSVKEDMDSGDPTRVSRAIESTLTFQEEAGIPVDDQSLASVKESEELGKAFEELRKGHPDTDGSIHQEVHKTLLNKYKGINSNMLAKATKDHIKHSSGRTNTPAVPTIAMPMALFEQNPAGESLTKQMWGAYANETNNIVMAMKETKLGKNELLSSVFQAVKGHQDVVALYNSGIGGENQYMYQGITKAMETMAYQFVAKGKSIDDAAQLASDALSEQIQVVTRADTSSVVVPTVNLMKFGLDRVDIEGGMSDLQQAKHLDRMNIHINYEKTLEKSGGNLWLSNSIKGVIDAKGLGQKEQDAEFARAFAGHIAVGNDSNNPGQARMYLKTDNGIDIPLVAETEEGFKNVTLDISKYTHEAREADFDARSKRIDNQRGIKSAADRFDLKGDINKVEAKKSSIKGKRR